MSSVSLATSKIASSVQAEEKSKKSVSAVFGSNCEAMERHIREGFKKDNPDITHGMEFIKNAVKGLNGRLIIWGGCTPTLAEHLGKQFADITSLDHDPAEVKFTVERFKSFRPYHLDTTVFFKEAVSEILVKIEKGNLSFNQGVQKLITLFESHPVFNEQAVRLLLTVKMRDVHKSDCVLATLIPSRPFRIAKCAEDALRTCFKDSPLPADFFKSKKAMLSRCREQYIGCLHVFAKAFGTVISIDSSDTPEYLDDIQTAVTTHKHFNVKTSTNWYLAGDPLDYDAYQAHVYSAKTADFGITYSDMYERYKKQFVQFQKEATFAQHISTSREMMEKGMKGLKGSAVIFGPGLLEPMQQFVKTFDKVTLAGNILLQIHSLIGQPAPKNVTLKYVDLTGELREVLEKMMPEISKKASKDLFTTRITKLFQMWKPQDLNLEGQVGQADYVVSSLIGTQILGDLRMCIENYFEQQLGWPLSKWKDVETYNKASLDLSKRFQLQHIRNLHQLVKDQGRVYYSDTIFEVVNGQKLGMVPGNEIGVLISKLFDVVEERQWEWVANSTQKFINLGFVLQKKAVK